MDLIFKLLEPLFNAVTQQIAEMGYWGIALGMAIESCNIPLPSEIILPFGGYLASTGQLTYFGASLAGAVGGTAGSIVSYFIGKLGGRPFILKYGKFFGITEKSLIMADYWFEKHGEATVFFTRNMPIIRTFISLPAGISRMNFPKFVIYSFLGALPWCFAMTYLGVKLGENWQDLKIWFHRADYLIFAAILLAILYFFFKKKKPKE